MASEDWTEVDVSTLSEDCRQAYLASKEAYRAYKAKRDEFEVEMQLAFGEHLGQGMELKFGYKFGKLSVAVGPKAEKRKAKQTVSLADKLDALKASGYAT